MTDKPVYQVIEELMEVVRQQGLIPTTIIISQIMLNRLVVECGTEETMRDGINTSFGDIEILTSRRCPPETLFVGAFE